MGLAGPSDPAAIIDRSFDVDVDAALAALEAELGLDPPDPSGVGDPANWTTMLQFVVPRPPSTVDDALVLARQHELVAECTLALPGVSTEQHAAFLLTADRWILHERP